MQEKAKMSIQKIGSSRKGGMNTQSTAYTQLKRVKEQKLAVSRCLATKGDKAGRGAAE